MNINYKGAAQQLSEVIQKMGALRTNPVLNILGNNPNIIENQKYPNGHLRFGDKSWRAYYHCHAAPNKLMNEHGHFHIFVRLRDENNYSGVWSHVVALAMDTVGQSLSWFTVNHWVTGNTWRSANELNPILDNLPIVRDVTLTEHWLMAMLRFYQLIIKELLQDRDARINQLKMVSDKEILNDRNYYELSRRPINILKELE